MRVLLLVFQFGFLFISFSSLIAAAKTSRTMLNNSSASGHPCLVPDFRGNAFNSSPLKIMFAVGLSYIAFIMLRYVSSIPAFWKVFFFNHKCVLNFVKGFLCKTKQRCYKKRKLQANITDEQRCKNPPESRHRRKHTST